MLVARPDTASQPLNHQRLRQMPNRHISSELPRLVGVGRLRQIRLFPLPPSAMPLSSVLTMTGPCPWVKGAQALAINGHHVPAQAAGDGNEIPLPNRSPCRCLLPSWPGTIARNSTKAYGRYRCGNSRNSTVFLTLHLPRRAGSSSSQSRDVATGRKRRRRTNQ